MIARIKLVGIPQDFFGFRSRLFVLRNFLKTENLTNLSRYKFSATKYLIEQKRRLERNNL